MTTIEDDEGPLKMPDLIGMTRDDARRTLESFGIKHSAFGLVREGSPPVVIEQTPDPDTVLSPNTHVRIRANSPRD